MTTNPHTDKFLIALYDFLSDPTSEYHSEIDWEEIPDFDAFLDLCETTESYDYIAADIEDMTFYVANDDGADQLADEYLDSYIDECVLYQIPENLRHYFDSDSFKEAAIDSDGRGHIISSYDGIEHEIKTDNDEWIFIYRV